MLRGLSAFAILSFVARIAQAQPAQSGPIAMSASDVASPLSSPRQDLTEVFDGALRAYHSALSARRLGQEELRLETIEARVGEGEELLFAGRVDEAIARLAELVEHPQFDSFADSQPGRAAVFRLGDALAVAGIDEPARAYLRRVIETKGAWDGVGTWARRAVRRLVDLALESGEFAIATSDMASIPPFAPEEVRGEIAYMNGRAKELAGDRNGALAAYSAVTQRCRFWAQATYLSGLIEVEKGNLRNAEKLLCQVADPERSATTTPVLADERFFAVRDLARLGLGRIAHEQGRNDDARFYYYLVPRDSERLAEALYEAATTRYEKKDYDGARDLLAELAGLGPHHSYEDEAWVLGAWVDLARCRFLDADGKLREFLARYGPVRDAARRIAVTDVALQRLLEAIHTGADAAGAEVGGASPEVVRTIAALVRVDPAYERVLRRRAVLERQASGLLHAIASIGDMQRALATNGGVRPSNEVTSDDDAQRAEDARSAVAGVDNQIAELESAGAPVDRVVDLRRELEALKSRLPDGAIKPGAGAPNPAAPVLDLPDLLRADAARGAALRLRLAVARKELIDAETALVKDALRRLDLRLSRLLRRASLGRIETVLGRKRALEVEVEAIRLGYLPQEAVDSLDAGHYLEDSEEYWPFEGDDWPDEYTGSELK
jgi:tetratricopeptide (TPR) repeat protein